MAKRPVFIAEKDFLGVKTIEIEFQWFSGMSINQKQKSIVDLHNKIKERGYDKVLEISSKSLTANGVSLSAFNLKTTHINKNIEFSVETAFQSSKVFENGGPYKDLLEKTSKEAKMDQRIRTSGNLVSFNFFGNTFPIKPSTLFYDWLYINVLLKNEILSKAVSEYNVFTDIEFNPEKSINCQAFSAALFVSMVRNKIDYSNIRDPKIFYEITKNVYAKANNIYQKNLF